MTTDRARDVRIRETEGRACLARRIAIVGSGGAGKSTLARQLGTALQLPVFHLDAYYWRPGWSEPATEEWAETHRRLLAEAVWIIDGNYGGTMDERLAAADTVIFLDLSHWLCLWRIVWRSLRYRGRTRSDMGVGCPEQLTGDFVRWVWRYPAATRPKVLARLAALPPATQVLRLRSPAAVRTLLRVACASRVRG